MADQQKEKVPEKKQTQEEEAETIASVRLAYQDLSMKAQNEERKMKNTDPAKAKQMERLGMGFNVRGNVSHSMMTDMKTIAQEPTPKFSTKIYEKEPKDDFFDDYSTSMYSSTKSSSQDPDLVMMGFESIEPIESRHSNVISMFAAQSPSSKRNQNSSSTNFSSSSSRNGNKSDKSYNTYENTNAQDKFGGARAISSEQFFGPEASSFERSANLAKFQGSNSISSADYFGENKNNTSSRGETLFLSHLILFVVFFFLFEPKIRQSND